MIESPTSESDIPGDQDARFRLQTAQPETSEESALTAQFMVQLGALLMAHQCEASPEGWRELAVMLALRYEPTFTDVSPVNQQGSAGPPKFTSDAWANARLLKRQIESRATSEDEAAELLQDWVASQGHRPHEAQLLDRLMVELRNARRTFPGWIHGWLRDRAVLKSAMLAAERLSKGCHREIG